MQRRHRLDGVRAADRLHARLGQTEVSDLAARDQILDRAGDLLDRHGRIDAVLVEQIDPIGLEPLQRRVGHFLDVRGPAIEPCLLAVFESEAELRRDHDLIADGRERLADELFVGERSVHLSGVEEGDAALHRRADQRDAGLPVDGLAVAEVQPHAAESDCRYFQFVLAKRSLLHRGPRQPS